MLLLSFRKNSGNTLVSLMAGLAMATIMILAVNSLFDTYLKSGKYIESKTEVSTVTDQIKTLLSTSNSCKGIFGSAATTFDPSKPASFGLSKIMEPGGSFLVKSGDVFRSGSQIKSIKLKQVGTTRVRQNDKASIFKIQILLGYTLSSNGLASTVGTSGERTWTSPTFFLVTKKDDMTIIDCGLDSPLAGSNNCVPTTGKPCENVQVSQIFDVSTKDLSAFKFKQTVVDPKTGKPIEIENIAVAPACPLTYEIQGCSYVRDIWLNKTQDCPRLVYDQKTGKNVAASKGEYLAEMTRALGLACIKYCQSGPTDATLTKYPPFRSGRYLYCHECSPKIAKDKCPKGIPENWSTVSCLCET